MVNRDRRPILSIQLSEFRFERRQFPKVVFEGCPLFRGLPPSFVRLRR